MQQKHAYRKQSGAIKNTAYIIRRNRREEMEIAGIAIDETVDITDKVCPLTFVKAKVALEELDDGEVIAIRMNDGEPVQNVPRSVKEEGHQILKLVDNEDGTYNLIVRKVEG
ncbi:sulfurtransferase TusA family protein [Roseburia intestinalis]|jgi:tRNA 2-thiouridine synthesizing protein A|uniref:Sulfurtransferase TusA family protein n=3 Tax=Roseburia intestinalis TaxID=166486 RepID=A0A414T9M7_9FIRM|nr:sulfurtransferase TusA family protein [Roseburia intestinalis]